MPLKNFFAILVFIFSNSLISYCQDDNKAAYRSAYEEQSQMLSGQKTVSFKRAVFLTENAYYSNELNY